MKHSTMNTMIVTKRIIHHQKNTKLMKFKKKSLSISKATSKLKSCCQILNEIFFCTMTCWEFVHAAAPGNFLPEDLE